MKAHLIWRGSLPGAIVQSAQDVVYVRRPEDDGTFKPPLDSIVVHIPPQAIASYDEKEYFPRCLAVRTVDQYDDETKMSGASPDVFNGALLLASPDRAYGFLFDGWKAWYPSLLKLQFSTGVVTRHTLMSDNNRFDRTFALAPDGRIIAASGMGVEIFQRDGKKVGDEWDYLDDVVGPWVATGSDFIAIYDPCMIDVCGYQGNRLARISSLEIEGRKLPLYVCMSSLAIDRSNRLWVLVHEHQERYRLVILSPTGQTIGVVNEQDLPISPKTLRRKQFIGMDRSGNLWAQRTDGEYVAFTVPELLPSGYAPAMTERGAITGLEPSLGSFGN